MKAFLPGALAAGVLACGFGATVAFGQAPNAAVNAHVAAAKSGVLSLTRTCAVEWGPYGVRVNGVNPGSTGNTEGVRRFAEAVRGGDSRPTNPMGVMSHGQDIALCVLFLVSPSARRRVGPSDLCRRWGIGRPTEDDAAARLTRAVATSSTLGRPTSCPCL